MTARVLTLLLTILGAAQAEGAMDAAIAPPDTPGRKNRVEATADEQGRFPFSEPAAGNSIGNGRRDGYRQTLYGATRTGRATIAVKPGERVSGIAVKTAPRGTIAGKVVNEKGGPMPGVEMVALRYSHGAWMWRPETPLKSYTDDLGEYRIPNLPAGPYVVRAAAAPSTGRTRAAGLGYPSLFYPGTPSPENAAPVPALSGETTLANFTLQPGAAFRITGRIEGYSPDRMVCFGLVPSRYPASVTQAIGRVSRFGADGLFAIDDVPPGAYVLSAAACGGIPPLSAIVPVDVAGDVDGLRIQLRPGQPLAGLVKGEGVDVGGLKLTLRSPDLIDVFPSNAVTAADGRFLFEHVFERRHIVDISPMPAGAYVKTVRYAGRPTPASGFLPAGGGALEITLSAQGAAQLRGLVVDREGRAAAYARVRALPADGGPAESATDAVADGQGNFVFPAVRPGTYQTLAWEAGIHPLAVETADPAIAMLFAHHARTVTVTAGAPGSVALRLNTMADVNRARAAAGMTPPRENR